MNPDIDMVKLLGWKTTIEIYILYYGMITAGTGIIACSIKYLFFDKPKAQEVKIKAEPLEQAIRKQVADEMVRRGL